jgi:zinc protease
VTQLTHITIGKAQGVLIQEPGVPLVTTHLRVATGGRDDPPGQAGLAHVVEHMMFSGTRQGIGGIGQGLERGEHARIIEAGGGFVNATTSADSTCYVHAVIPEFLGTVLDLERARFAATAFTDEGMAADKAIVLRERFQRTRGRSFGDATERLLAAVYTDGNGYGHLPVGDQDGVSRITVADCYGFFSQHYHDAATSLVIIGDFDQAAVTEHASRLLDAFPEAAADGAVDSQSGDTGLIRTTTREEIPGSGRSQVFIAQPMPPLGSADFALAEMGAVALAHGASSLLQRRLIGERGVAQAAKANVVARHRSASMGVLQIAPSQGTTAEEVIAELDRVMCEVVMVGLHEIDRERARSMYASSWLAEDDSLISRAASLGESLQVHGGIDSYQCHLDLIAALGPEQFDRGVRFWHQPDRRAEVVYLP